MKHNKFVTYLVIGFLALLGSQYAFSQINPREQTDTRTYQRWTPPGSNLDYERFRPFSRMDESLLKKGNHSTQPPLLINSPSTSREIQTTITFDDTVVLAWARQSGPIGTGYLGFGISSDGAADIAVDSEGNVYVTGASSTAATGKDYFTIKYDPSGQMLWSARYDGPAHKDDIPIALTIDGSGNVYVTGSTFFFTGDDYLTIKYDHNGGLLWETRYEGIGNMDDSPIAIDVDSESNVYVTGSSYTLETNWDFATVKYDASGTQQWVARYNGSADGQDEPQTRSCLRVDQSGNVYVAGGTTVSGNGVAFVTIKYNASGLQEWIATLGGNYDVATSLAVDPLGNVYVSGWIGGASSNYGTVKYDQNGIEQWIQLYNGTGNGIDVPRRIVLHNPSGSIYVTGRSAGSGSRDDYATVKYDSAGNELWVQRYNGPVNLDDGATSIAVDNAGNVYVTGTSMGDDHFFQYATLKYAPDGSPQWLSRYYPDDYDPLDWRQEAVAYTPSELAVDSLGNVYVTGTGNWRTWDGFQPVWSRFETIKYLPNGTQEWATDYNGVGMFLGGPTALEVDRAGGVYVSGGVRWVSIGEGNHFGHQAIKYSSEGSIDWYDHYRNSGNSIENAPTFLVVDSLGNAFVAGTSGQDYRTTKYDLNGHALWVSTYNGPGNEWDVVSDIALDSAGNAYVTGRSFSSSTASFDYATVKYNSVIGTQEWTARYNGPESLWDGATGIIVDGSGNIYVIGASFGSGNSYDFATIKYTTTGVEQWVARYDGPGNSWDMPTAIVSDNVGNIYVSGWSYNSSLDADYATIKLNSSGEQQWVARYNGPGNSWDMPTDIEVDGLGNIYVTGWSGGLSTNSDYLTIKYNASGVQQWVARYDGSGNSVDEASGLAIDNERNVYVTGRSINPDGLFSFETLKYDSSGVLRWGTRYKLSQDSQDGASAIAVDGDGNIYVTGWSWQPSGTMAFTTIKYFQAEKPPAAPQNLTATPGDGQVFLAWTPHTEPDFLRYRIYMSTPPFSITLIDSANDIQDTTSTISELVNGTRYIFYLSALDTNLNESELTAGVEVTPGVISTTSNEAIPAEYALNAAYPNPFNPNTTIKYALKEDTQATLKVYDLLGREVRLLVNEHQPAAYHAVVWDGRDRAGRPLPSGIYIARLVAGDFVAGIKMVLLK